MSDTHQHSLQVHSEDSILNTISPPIRILCSLMLLIAIAITPNGKWLTWFIYGTGLSFIVGMAQIDLFKLFKRLTVELIFLMVALLGILFRNGDSLLWQWGILKITTVGLTTFGSILCKLVLSLVIMNLLTLTLPVSTLLESLSILQVPPLLIAILGSMYRYLDLLVEEFTTMRRAAIARNLMSSKHWHRIVVGNMVGSLFIRTYDRGDRIHQAMISRGYQNSNLAVSHTTKIRKRDRLALGLTFLFIIFGQWAYYY